MSSDNNENNSVPSTVEQTAAPIHQTTIQSTPLGKILSKKTCFFITCDVFGMSKLF
jgi:hypothetical protein